MAHLERDDWYDIARDTDWTLSYVDEAEAFPASWSGTGGTPKEAWRDWDEPFRVTYRDYVQTQRDKDTNAYAVRAALSRSRTFEQLDEGWKGLVHLHMGATCLVEQSAVTMEGRFARFAPSAAWRNLAVYGMLDEIRHTQLNLSFSHELLKKDPRFDWCHKAYHSNEWAMIAVRKTFDTLMLNDDCVDASIAINVTLEHGFTNMQFVAFAAEAMEAGDLSFSNLLTSIQTDEARHAQQGFATLAVLARNDKKRAQQLLDKSFWLSLRIFQTLTGPTMDYYTPLSRRKQSFKEFMQEWIIHHHERTLRDFGLERPWYWEVLDKSFDNGHHALQLGSWFWRPTLFWKPSAGVSRAERRWLNEKYPTWEENWGPLWDVIGRNVVEGRMEKTFPETLPSLCNMCHLPLGSAFGPKDLRPYMKTHNGKLYHFCSAPCQWIFELEPEKHEGHLTVVERFISGQIQPMNLPGTLEWMGLTPDVMGDDAHGYAWARDYKTA
jgi:toluene monooxygenase system protein A